MSHRLTALRILLTAAALAACGDDGGSTTIDGRTVDGAIDGASSDAATDAPDTDAAATDAAATDAATDAAATDAATDATTDAATPIDASTDAAPDAMTDAMTPLPGDICTSAELITLPGGVGTTTVNATTLGYTNNYLPGVCVQVNSPGADRVHVISVPAGNRLLATVTPTAGTFDPSIFLIGGPAASCDAVPMVCLAGSDGGGDGAPDVVAYNNSGGGAVDVFIIIDGFRAIGNAYSLAVTVGPIPAIPPGDTCQLAELVTLTAGMATVVATTATAAAYTNNYAPANACTGFAEPGNDRVHIVNVAGGQRLTATVTPTSGTFDVSVYIIGTPATTCDLDPVTCLAGSDQNDIGAAETTIYDNASLGAVDVFVVVDSFNSGGDGYMLAVTVAPPPAGESCSDPERITLTGGTATVNATTVGYLDSHDPSNYPPASGCTNYYTDGPDRLHVVSVPALQTLTVVLTPAANYDAAVYLIAPPAASCSAVPVVCLDGEDLLGQGGNETVTYTNPGNAAVDVFVGIDGDGLPAAGSPSGTYSLAVTTAP